MLVLYKADLVIISLKINLFSPWYRFMFMVFNAIFQQYFSYIVVVSFIGGGNRSTWRKPPTCRKSLSNFIT
jgi:hypothetical protein